MSDIFSKEKRSNIMSNIHSKETKPEVLVRKFLFSKGFRFRKNVTQLPGTPDIVLKKYKTIIFINGCFWHGHNCKKASLPQTNYEFWKKKIDENKKRDTININQLKIFGWNIILLWQCEIKNKIAMARRMELLIKEITFNRDK